MGAGLAVGALAAGHAVGRRRARKSVQRQVVKMRVEVPEVADVEEGSGGCFVVHRHRQKGEGGGLTFFLSPVS